MTPGINIESPWVHNQIDLYDGPSLCHFLLLGYTIYQFNPWHLPTINVPTWPQYNGINTMLDITLYPNKVISTIVNYPCTVSNCILDDQIIIVGSPHLTCIQSKFSISTHTASHRGKGFHDKILYSDKKPDEVISQNRIMVDRIFENFHRILSLNGP